MIRIPCPHCGPRDAAEFAYVGERATRPDPATTTPGQWRSYLYLRRNPAGWTDESWHHRAGCGRFLAVSRHTVTGEIRTVRDGSREAGRWAGDGTADAPG